MAFHLAIALDAAGWNPSAASESDAQVDERLTASWWLQVVGEADRDPFALVTIADHHRRCGEAELWGSLDAMLVAVRVAPTTQRVGILPSISTTISEPFLVSTQVATLDYVSGGRGGWVVEVSSDPQAGGYVGPRTVVPVAERDAEADEFVEVVRRLWDSWEDDAEIRDATTHRFIDRERIHHVNFAGRYLSVGGPSITPRSPQGQPIIATQAYGGASDRFAATRADVAFVAAPAISALPERLADLRGGAPAAEGRPEGPLCLVDVAVFLEPSRASAERRRDQCVGRDHRPGLSFAGTPRELAAWLLELAELGADGARLHPATIAHDLYGITRELPVYLPAGTSVAAGTLRDRLGLPRPANRYAVPA